MANTPQSAEQVCTHERRPGTTVCLHCRHAALEAARAKRRRFLLRSATTGAVGATFLVVGVLGATVIREKGIPHYKSLHSFTSRTIVRPATKTPAPAPAPAIPVTQQAKVDATPPIAPQLPSGVTPFQDGISATRAGDSVTVAFDTPMTRTRRPEKFEHFMRVSLPVVYGAVLDTVLDKIPEGTLVAQGDLLSELPTRGVRIPVRSGWSLVVYPETRPGEDGPLVVRYRASVVADTVR